MSEVRESFDLALAGRITPPPENWLTAPLWELPHNLPDTFDHSVTGLIGRTREFKELLSQLRNPRFGLLAIISPGGLGKTAILLEILKSITRSPDSLAWVDRVFYVSSKTEMLTADGIAEIDSPYATIEAIKKALIKLAGFKVLCIARGICRPLRRARRDEAFGLSG